MIGTTFGRLVVVAPAPTRNKGKMVECRCSCGNTKQVAAVNLRKGLTRSCGCLRRETSRMRGHASATHGHSKAGRSTRVYRAWASMLARCQTPTDASYQDYGGRGITVCARWQTFLNFLEDMGEPGPGLSLDRIDNDRIIDSYSKENCRWATSSQQRLNQRPRPRKQKP